MKQMQENLSSKISQLTSITMTQLFIIKLFPQKQNCEVACSVLKLYILDLVWLCFYLDQHLRLGYSKNGVTFPGNQRYGQGFPFPFSGMKKIQMFKLTN